MKIQNRRTVKLVAYFHGKQVISQTFVESLGFFHSSIRAGLATVKRDSNGVQRAVGKCLEGLQVIRAQRYVCRLVGAGHSKVLDNGFFLISHPSSMV